MRYYNKVMRSFFLYFIIMFLTVSCAPSISVNVVPDLTYEHIAPVPLNVKSLEIIDEYQPALAMPYVEHNLTTPLYTAAERMMQKAFFVKEGASQNYILKLIIKEASIRLGTEHKVNKLSQLFGDQAFKIYHGRIHMHLEIVDENGAVAGSGNSVVTRDLKMPEHYSLTQRNKMFFLMSEDMTRDLHQAINKLMKQKFFILLE